MGGGNYDHPLESARMKLQRRGQIRGSWVCPVHLQGVPKKIIFKLIFEFLILVGVFLGVKNNSKNFGNKKI